MNDVGRPQSTSRRAWWLFRSMLRPGTVRECSECGRLGERSFVHNGGVTGFQCLNEVPCKQRRIRQGLDR